MDSHSRSASPREPMRPQIRPPSPPSPTAFDNRAYQHDEEPNESFTSNGTSAPVNGNGVHNGHKPNGDTKLPEAVNLELINLTPKNGTKKDTAVDMNASNPYDEYFVPVNEHRKFMRGEKLYVTADKRGEKGGCKRPLCWTLLVLVVAAIVAVIVLAATGILFSGSPTTLEQYNTTISSARAFGGIVHDHDHDHSVHDHSAHDHSGNDHSAHDHSGNDHSGHDHIGLDQSETTDPTQNQHGPQTQSDDANIQAGSDENDMSLYVPKTLEGELKIDNEEYTPELEDVDSNEYREFAASFAEGLRRALLDRNLSDNGNNDLKVEIIGLRKGSVIVTYRIHWTPKPNNAASLDELLTVDSLKTRLEEYLANNQRMINVYHVAEENVAAKHVLDICQIENNQCEHGCTFDETTLDFTCTCPHGQILDVTNPKRCKLILENSFPPEEPETNQPAQNEVKIMTVDSNPSTVKPIPEEEKSATESIHVANEPFDWEKTIHAIPETTTERETDINFSHIFGLGNREHKTEAPVPEPSAEPEPTAEPKAEAEPEPYAEPTAEPAVEAAAEPAAEPVAEPAAEPVTEADAKHFTDSAAEPAAEPTAEPAAEPAAEPSAEPAAEPAAEPTAEPAAEHGIKLVPETVTKPATEPALEPTTKPAPEPTAEPAVELSTEPAIPELEPTFELEPAAVSNLTSKSEANIEVSSSPTLEFTSKPEAAPGTRIEPEPTLEPEAVKNSIIEPEVTSESELILPENSNEASEPNKIAEPEPISQENPFFLMNEGNNDHKSTEEMEPTTTRVSISEPKMINEPSYEPKPEMVAILSEHSPVSNVLAGGSSETTTETNEWLEDKTAQDETLSVIKLENHKKGESEARSFKSIDIYGEQPTTTEKLETIRNDEILPLDIKNKENNNMEEAFTNSPITFEPFTNENIEKNTLKPKSEETLIKHAMYQNTSEEIQLMEALSNKNLTETETSSTKSLKSDEGTDITFDNINSLYNRSSKAIENDANILVELNKHVTTHLTINDDNQSTTESDWLLEPATEINFEEAINKMGNQETTESVVKVDEIINNGKYKDDFEPDYLSNMSTNKMSEDPMYTMVHDYDSEDSRVKRVNEDKQITTDIAAKDSSKIDIINFVTKSPMPVDATTVVEYIYKSTEKFEDNPASSNKIPGSSITQAPLSEDTKPAPVWEESESNITVLELQTSKAANENTTTPRSIMNNENVLPADLMSKNVTAAEVTTTQTTEALIPSTMDQSTANNLESVSRSDTETQNTTQVNNLNVTIYEISNLNKSISAAKDASTHASLFEDHETEMNPFLPEIENNKILVKKLQEGHDIEPSNLTETQNDNTEEHSNFSDATAHQANANDKVTTTTPATSAENATSDELIKTSHENKTELVYTIKSTENSTDKEKPPGSTFLQDTDDLDIKEHTTERKTTIVENNFKTGIVTASPSPTPDDDSDYLSVVPIEEERLEENEALRKNFNSESMQELNDISDSPKKSDRRTLVETKFDSVLNNEA